MEVWLESLRVPERCSSRAGDFRRDEITVAPYLKKMGMIGSRKDV